MTFMYALKVLEDIGKDIAKELVDEKKRSTKYKSSKR